MTHVMPEHNTAFPEVFFGNMIAFIQTSILETKLQSFQFPLFSSVYLPASHPDHKSQTIVWRGGTVHFLMLDQTSC